MFCDQSVGVVHFPILLVDKDHNLSSEFHNKQRHKKVAGISTTNTTIQC